MKAPHLGGRGVLPAILALALSLTLAAGSALAEAPPAPIEPPSQVGEVVDEAEAGNRAAAQAQALIEKLSDDTDALAAEYRKALQEKQSLAVYNKQLEDMLVAQDKEIASLDRQIGEVDVVQREVTPLMLRMIETLGEFVRLDVPFLPEERANRVAGLREMMGRADVALSEKYRRLMEAYQVENEYGRTIEAYRGALEADADKRTVDFLRVGRVALLYQTLDGNETGFWNRQTGQWEALPADYRSPVKQGLQIARKQIAPDLVRIPVPAPEVVQ